MCGPLSRAIRKQPERWHLTDVAEVKQLRYGGDDLLQERPVAEIGLRYREAGTTADSVGTNRWYAAGWNWLKRAPLPYTQPVPQPQRSAARC